MRQAFEEAVSCGVTFDFNSEETAFASCAFIAFARFEPSHQFYGRAKGKGNLLVTSTNSKCWLRGLLYHFNHAGQLLRRVSVPGMTPAAQNNMRWMNRLNALKRNGVVGLNQYLQTFAHASKRGSQFAGTRALPIQRVVDEINERSSHGGRLKGKG